MEELLDFLAGGAALGYTVAGMFFLKFWRNSADRLFLAFGAAFFLLALNQVIASAFEAGDERTVYAYGLRVLGFVLILWAIIEKNLAGRRGQKR